MVAGNKRSRSQRRVAVKTPGGKVVTHYSPRKPNAAVCGSCGARLHGVARDIPSRLGRLSKSQKRPSRPFAGNLCTKCMRKEIIARAST